MAVSQVNTNILLDFIGRVERSMKFKITGYIVCIYVAWLFKSLEVVLVARFDVSLILLASYRLSDEGWKNLVLRIF